MDYKPRIQERTEKRLKSEVTVKVIPDLLPDPRLRIKQLKEEAKAQALAEKKQQRQQKRQSIKHWPHIDPEAAKLLEIHGDSVSLRWVESFGDLYSRIHSLTDQLNKEKERCIKLETQNVMMKQEIEAEKKQTLQSNKVIMRLAFAHARKQKMIDAQGKQIRGLHRVIRRLKNTVEKPAKITTSATKEDCKKTCDEIAKK